MGKASRGRLEPRGPSRSSPRSDRPARVGSGPRLVQCAHERYESFETERLDMVGVGAMGVGLAYVLLKFGTGENDDGEIAQFRMSADPGKDFKTRGARHFQIKKDERRHRVTPAIGINTLTTQISDC